MADAVPFATVTVLDAASAVLAEVSPVPATVAALKLALEECTGTPHALIRLLQCERLLNDEDDLPQDESFELMLCVDETPLSCWDIGGNPARDQIEGEAGHLLAPNLRSDFVNVVTQEPVRSGLHFFEFVVHKVQDEQWCGVVTDASQAGSIVTGFRLRGTFYYFNHHGARSGLKKDCTLVTSFSPPRDGDVIGMLVDVDERLLVFALNGVVQGTSLLPHGPLFFFTTVDRPDDHMELRKIPVAEAPAVVLAAYEEFARSHPVQ
mmetsp:Transcript_76984/g.213996  ORF Transcript_76984/g.213996 Transcript_76984/m.213996 type:complete len:264 (+) Transcript_76984:85-876(+)